MLLPPRTELTFLTDGQNVTMNALILGFDEYPQKIES
jgi:hypothetical protein